MSQSTGSQTQGFLFADLRDYTRFVETHADQAAADLLARLRLLTREVIGRFDGAEIRTEGDSFYVVFPTASGRLWQDDPARRVARSLAGIGQSVA